MKEQMKKLSSPDDNVNERNTRTMIQTNSTVMIGSLKWMLSEWCRSKMTDDITSVTYTMLCGLAHELEEVLAKKHDVDIAPLVDSVKIVGFKRSDEEQLWTHVLDEDWQCVVDWAMRFAEFSGYLHGVYLDGIKLKKLI